MEQLLVQLLAGAQAGEADLDVHLGPEAGEAYHLLGEAGDGDGLAHIEDEDLAVFASLLDAERRRLEDQFHRLAHGHEEALDVGVGDGDRPARLELLLEQQHDGTGRSEDVAEADGDEPGPPPFAAAFGLRGAGEIEGLAIAFGEALGRAHDRDRVDRLVGGNLHHRHDPRRPTGVGDVARADGVDRRRFIGVGLDQRHMFERRRVEHEVRSLGGEQGFEFVSFSHVAENGRAPEAGMAPGNFEIDGVERELGMIEQRQMGRREIGDLTGEFGPDGAAGAGDHDPPAGDQGLHGVAVEHRLGPAEEVLERHRPDLQAIGDVAPEIGKPRQARKRQPEPFGLLEKRAHGCPVKRVFGDDQPLRTGSLPGKPRDHAAKRRKVPHDVEAVDLAPDPGAFVVHQPDHPVTRARAGLHGTDEKLGPVAGADQQHRNSRRIGAVEHGAQPTVLQHAVNQPGPGKKADEHEPVDAQRRARQAFEPGDPEQRQDEDEDRQRHRLDDL